MPWISSIYFILNKNANFTSSIIAALVLVQSKYFLHVFARYLNGILVLKIDIWVKWLKCFAKGFSKITFSCFVRFTPPSKRASERGVQPGETTGAIECFNSRGQYLCKFIGTKKMRLHKKRVQLPEYWFGTPKWRPFHCFGTPIWPPWRHVKTFYIRKVRGKTENKHSQDSTLAAYEQGLVTSGEKHLSTVYWGT